MTRKRRSRQRNFPWPILMFGGILLIAAAVLLASQGNNGGGSAASSSGSPMIAVEPAKIDYGAVKFGTPESIKIKVTNNGNAVLKFNEEPYIEVLEGC